MFDVVISDLDGTLLSNDHKLNNETLNVIRELKKNNINFIIATGRSYVDAKRIIEHIGFPIPVIAGNGTQLYDENFNKIHSYKLKEEYVEFLYNIDYKSFGEEILLNTVTEDKWYLDTAVSEDNIINDWIEPEWKYIVKEKQYIDKKDINKLFFVGEHNNLIKLKEYIENKYKDSINLAFTLTFCLEIFPKEATKANALMTLSKLKGYDLSNSIAFGDGYNDVEMLELATKACVMANAPDSLKKALPNAEIISENYNQGVAKKLKEIYKWL